MKKIIVDGRIFEKFPRFTRGIIVIEGMENHEKNTEIEKMLDEQVREKANINCIENELVKIWDDVYVKLGVNPNKFPPSIKSLLKRVAEGNAIPFINSAVALFNYVSLKYLIPCGGDDADMIEGNFKLGIASGKENFTPLGSVEVENPEFGEVIYFDDKTLNVMCRRWNWRNGDFSKINACTEKTIINVDGMDSVGQSVVVPARDELASLFLKYCNANTQVDLLDVEKQEISI